MKIKTKKTISKKTLFLGIGLPVLIIACLSAYVFVFKGTFFGWSPLPASSYNSSINYDKPTKEQVDTGTTTKQNSTSPVEDGTKPNSGSDQPPAPTPQPNGKAKVDITITTPIGSAASSFSVRSIIGAVTNSGTCTLTFTKHGNTSVTKTAGVQAMASTSTCQGFEITLSPGIWQMTLHFENETLTGEVSQAVTIQ